MKFARPTAVMAFAGLALAAAPAAAKDYQVKMLNKGSDGKLMVFEPAFLQIGDGDSVTFVPTNAGHNAESIAGMTPAGAQPFAGKINQELKGQVREGRFVRVQVPSPRRNWHGGAHPGR